MTRARGIRLGLLLTLAAVLHVSMPAAVSWWPSAPALSLALIVAVAWTAGPEAGAVTGFAAGMLLDLVPPSAHPIGQWAVVLAVLGYLIALILHHEERLVPALGFTALAVALTEPAYALVGVTLGQTASQITVLSTATAFGWGLFASALTLPVARRARRPEPPLSLGGPLPAGLLEDWERAAA